MQVVAKRALRECREKHPRSRAPLEAWYGIVTKDSWTGPADVKAPFGTTVSFVGDSRIIFDIGGDKDRLVAHVDDRSSRMPIQFIGTHRRRPTSILRSCDDGYPCDSRRR